jgi:hypothetical protein
MRLKGMVDIDKRRLRRNLNKAKKLEEEEKELHTIKEWKAEEKVWNTWYRTLRSLVRK